MESRVEYESQDGTNRKGFGHALAENGGDERVLCLALEISGSITISDFYSGKPERKNRWISMGIAEQSATSVAAGLAKEGKLPVFGTYATFAAQGPQIFAFCAREANPVVTDEQTPFVLGKANGIRLRQPGESFQRRSKPRWKANTRTRVRI